MPLIACEHADKLQLCGRESWVSLCTCVCVCGEGCGGRCAGQTFNLAQMQKLFASQRPRGPCLPSLSTKRSRYEWTCVGGCVCVCGFRSGKLPKPTAYCKLKCATSMGRRSLPRRGVVAVFVASSKQTCHVRAATSQVMSVRSPTAPTTCL